MNTQKSLVESITDSELAWIDFVADHAGSSASQLNQERYIRINPDLGAAIPTLDAKHKIKELRASIQNHLQSWETKQILKDVAYRLVASTFYFDKYPLQSSSGDGSLLYSGMHSLLGFKGLTLIESRSYTLSARGRSTRYQVIGTVPERLTKRAAAPSRPVSTILRDL